MIRCARNREGERERKKEKENAFSRRMDLGSRDRGIHAARNTKTDLTEGGVRLSYTGQSVL